MWQEWYRRQWNQPGLTDHYLMQVSAEIRNFMEFLLVKKPRQVSAADFEIKFKFGTERKTEEQLDEEQRQRKAAQTMASKMQWSAILGVNLLDPEQAIKDQTMTVSQT